MWRYPRRTGRTRGMNFKERVDKTTLHLEYRKHQQVMCVRYRETFAAQRNRPMASVLGEARSAHIHVLVVDQETRPGKAINFRQASPQQDTAAKMATCSSSWGFSAAPTQSRSLGDGDGGDAAHHRRRESVSISYRALASCASRASSAPTLGPSALRGRNWHPGSAG